MVFGTSIREILLSVLLGLFGGMLLKAFYSMVRVKAPTAYAYGVSHLQRSARSSIAQYLCFRFAPVFLVGLAISVTAERLGLMVALALLSCIVLFVILSSGRSIYCRLVAPGKGAGFHTVLQLGSAVLTGLIAIMSYYLYPLFFFLVPDPSEFVIAIWTAAFVAIVSHTFAKVTSGVGDYLDDSERIEMVIEDIGKDKWSWILQECRNSGVPSCVVAAIVVVEVNERPSWMRVLERVCGYICLQRVVMSYGITQERSKPVLTDEESVRVTIRWVSDHLSARTIELLSVRRRDSLSERGLGSNELISKAFYEVQELLDARNPDGKYGMMVERMARCLYYRCL